MKNEEFLRLCKAKVAEYTNSHMDKTDGKQITVQDVYVVWSCKTLQNSKALLSTTVPDGMYYELTYNGDKHELYHRILYVSNTVNSHCSISVISLISEKIRKKQLAGEIQQPYQKIVTYETEKFSDLSIKEAYEYLKTLPEFEGAEDVFEDKDNSV